MTTKEVDGTQVYMDDGCTVVVLEMDKNIKYAVLVPKTNTGIICYGFDCRANSFQAAVQVLREFENDEICQKIDALIRGECDVVCFLSKEIHTDELVEKVFKKYKEKTFAVYNPIIAAAEEMERRSSVFDSVYIG